MDTTFQTKEACFLRFLTDGRLNLNNLKIKPKVDRSLKIGILFPRVNGVILWCSLSASRIRNC